jgi:C4-type Zn-finger protein
MKPAKLWQKYGVNPTGALCPRCGDHLLLDYTQVFTKGPLAHRVSVFKLRCRRRGCPFRTCSKVA